MTEHDVPESLARRVQDDPWARGLGIEYLELRPGYCRTALTLQPNMVNYLRSAHGAVIFALADAAFGAACNSHGEPAVALSMTIGFLAAPPPAGRLVAECRERRQGRRAGFYDVTVTDGGGTLVAVLQCVAHRVGPTRDEIHENRSGRLQPETEAE